MTSTVLLVFVIVVEISSCLPAEYFFCQNIRGEFRNLFNREYLSFLKPVFASLYYVLFLVLSLEKYISKIRKWKWVWLNAGNPSVLFQRKRTFLKDIIPVPGSEPDVELNIISRLVTLCWGRKTVNIVTSNCGLACQKRSDNILVRCPVKLSSLILRALHLPFISFSTSINTVLKEVERLLASS